MSEISELPDPPVPAEADLKGFLYTPIYRARLFGSAFHARATDSEWRAGVTLWLKSQDQTPPGSLPEDDVELCRLAELGRDLRTWRKLKGMALHGWYKCKDGRLYHDTVAQVVSEQLTSRDKAVERKAGWRDRKRRQREGQKEGQKGEVTPMSRVTRATVSRTPEGTIEGQPRDNGECHSPVPPMSPLNRREENRREEKGSKESAAAAALVQDPPRAGAPAAAAALVVSFIAAFDAQRSAIYGANQARLNPAVLDSSTAQKWASKGATVELVTGVCQAVMGRMKKAGKPPPDTLAYLTGAMADALAAAAQPMPEGRVVGNGAMDYPQVAEDEIYNGRLVTGPLPGQVQIGTTIAGRKIFGKPGDKPKFKPYVP